MRVHLLRPEALLLLVLAVAPAASAQMLWSQRSNPSTIRATSSYPVTYDAARRRVVMLALTVGPVPPMYQGTQEWDGFTWRNRQSANLPHTGTPDAFAMAYDAGRGKVVLFGGSQSMSTILHAHTWAWDGTDWTQRAPSTVPPGRKQHAMAYDATRKRVVMFGGLAGVAALNDTWEWSGADWKRVFPVFSPPARSEHAMAYDAARGRLVLFGGICGIHFGDTWEWMGNTWIRRTTSVSPPARCGHAMAYDATRRRVVLFGGRGAGGVLGDTWEWDGATWTRSASVTAPSARSHPAMAYHAAAQRMVLFGGRLAAWPSGGLAQDVWEYGDTHLSVSGLSRPGHVMSMVLLAGSDVGRIYQIGSALGGGPIAVGHVSIGLEADNLLALSGSGAWPAIFRGYRGVVDANGQATAAIRIPADPNLAGATIHSAFVTLDPKRPAGIRAVSNSVNFQIKP